MDNFLKAMEQQSTENGFLRKVIGENALPNGNLNQSNGGTQPMIVLRIVIDSIDGYIRRHQ